MNATETMTTTNTEVDVVEEVTEYGVKTIIVVSALIGIWGLACLIGGFAVAGPSGLAAGFLASFGL